MGYNPWCRRESDTTERLNTHIQHIQTAYTTQHQEKQTTKLKNGQKNWIDIFPKRKYRWPTSTWKDTQYHQSPGKYKSRNAKGQHDITSYVSEWLSSKRTWITNVDEDLGKREPLYMVAGMWIGAVTMENSMGVWKFSWKTQINKMEPQKWNVWIDLYILKKLNLC